MNQATDVRASLRVPTDLDELTGWRLLAAQVAELSLMSELTDVVQHALRSACRLTSAGSAMLVNLIGGSQVAPVTVIGPMADELYDLPDETVAELARRVSGARSWCTGTMLIVPLTAHGRRWGLLVVADERSIAPATDVVEQLEVLGCVVAATLGPAIDIEDSVESTGRDSLTGLGLRHAFSRRLAEMAGAGVRHAVLSIDVDHLQRVNDLQGHEAGDGVLCTVAQAMNAALRVDDCLFRTGGDEFAVAVPVRSESDALSIADRIQRATRRVGLPVSIGVAVVGADERDIHAAFARADAALCRVKLRGRDGTALAHPDQPVSGGVRTTTW